MRADRRTPLVIGIVLALILSAGILMIAPKFFPALSPHRSAITNSAAGPNGEIRRIEAFLSRRPMIEARLLEDPALVHDQAFLKNHPLFEQMLEEYPEILVKLAANPRWFVHRQLLRQSVAPIAKAEITGFDDFLDHHPEIERLLLKQPQLLRQPDFLKSHTELDEYLKQHPEINRAAIAKPSD